MSYVQILYNLKSFSSVIYMFLYFEYGYNAFLKKK